ncbi:hypothetical protein KDK88_04020 [bacterium]|nr:hypothetical protein [bacterium]HPF35844.1 hypothetical protein [Candidatus Krumholzibacteria bacterium]HRX50851.1 hypothetical protein [Candidatus Krumholzibacteria bacterium]
MNDRKILPLLLALGLLVLALSGCIFSPDPDPDPTPIDPPDYETALTPELMMANFKTAYEEKDINGYRDEVLDDRFLFFFLEDEDQAFWDKTEDLASMTNLFSGEARTNSQGQLTRAISQITMDQLTLLEPFTASDNLYFQGIDGVLMGLYKITIVLTHPAGTITVDSNQRFYAAPQVENGVTIYKLIGQEDMPS